MATATRIREAITAAEQEIELCKAAIAQAEHDLVTWRENLNRLRRDLQNNNRDDA